MFFFLPPFIFLLVSFCWDFWVVCFGSIFSWSWCGFGVYGAKEEELVFFFVFWGEGGAVIFWFGFGCSCFFFGVQKKVFCV